MKNPFENMGKKVRNTVVRIAALGLTVAGEAKFQNKPQRTDQLKLLIASFLLLKVNIPSKEGI